MLYVYTSPPFYLKISLKRKTLSICKNLDFYNTCWNTWTFFESIIEEKLRGNIIIAASLIIWGIVMIIIERRKEPKEIDFKDISWKQSLTMG